MEANLTHSSFSEDQSEQHYYINMEVIDNYYSNEEFEFEFQSSVSTFSFPAADHLFHMGKLLIPHQNNDDGSSSTFTTPIFTHTTTSANNTPFESCNISPSDSRRHISGELDPSCDDQVMTSSGRKEKKYPNWAKFLNPARNKWTTYLKSLFTKKQCSNGHFKTSVANKDRRKKQSFSKPKTASSSEVFRAELENPIQAAIAHCKRSHKQTYSKQIAAI